ncbi:MAG: alpha/beta hydrolase [Flavobacterium sp.]
MSKIAVYFMPGLAANPKIFERISLPESTFEIIFLEWEIPLIGETLLDYAERMSKKVTHENAVLVGVSFGGVIVQEMAKFIKVKKVIIISSVKSNLELPPFMRLAKKMKLYKILPTGLVQNLEQKVQRFVGNQLKERLHLYEKYLSVRNKQYLDWSIYQLLFWEQTSPIENIIHIQGDQDKTFPIKYIQNCIVVKGGTHVMILNRYKWFNDNLPKLILK